MLEKFKILSHAYAAASGEMSEGTTTERRLGDLAGYFADEAAYTDALEEENRLLYRVSAIEPAHDVGDLHCGLGVLYPGKIGREYHLTKGHLHATRGASEIYIGLSGEGCMLLEDEVSGESRLEPFGAGRIVYVPGHTAHRTINTGEVPLSYFGVYPADAGHDYGVIAERNFLKVVVEENGRPTLQDR